MRLCADGLILTRFNLAIRWRRIKHAYGIGIWVPDSTMFPDRLILGIGIIITLEWIKIR